MVRFQTPPEESFARLKRLGLHCCQLAAVPDEYLYGQVGRDNTARLKDSIAEYGITVDSVFLSFLDQDWSDPVNGIGLTPPHTRAERLARSCRYADWVAELGVKQIACHTGMLRKEPDPHFIAAMRYFCRFLGENGQFFCYETGQETAAALRRLMEEIGEPNQYLNFDPANLLIYDTQDPREFLRTMTDRVMHVHCKDARRAAPGETRGREVVLGQGDTGFAEIYRTLRLAGFAGPWTIEREIPPGEELDRDTADAVAYLNGLEKRFGK